MATQHLESLRRGFAQRFYDKNRHNDVLRRML